MKVAILLCVVSCVFGGPAPPPYGAAPAPGAPCPTAAVQAAPVAAPLPGPPVPLPGPAGPAPPVNPALLAKLKPRVDQFTAAFASGNADTFTAMFTPDAVIYPDHDYSYYDHVGAKKWQAKSKAANMFSSPIQILDIKDLQSYLVMHGRFQDTRGAGDLVMWWTDVNGQLLLKSMMYNYDGGFTTNVYDTLGDAATKQKVAARLHDWERLFAAGDIEGLSQIYHEFAKVFPYNTFKHEGREGVRKVFQDSRDNGTTKTVYTIMEARQSGDTVTTWMYYQDYKNNDVLNLCTNVMVMEEVGGQLLIKYDIFTEQYDERERTPVEKMAQAYYDDWTALFNAGNIPAVVAKYEPDASRMLSEEPATVGIPAIQQNLQADYNTGHRYKYEVRTAVQMGDYVLATGRQQTIKDDVVIAMGSLMDLLKVVPGGKLHHVWDVYSTN